MSKKDKLIQRILSQPSDFTFDELVALFGYLGYSKTTPGKTGGSRASFTNSGGDYIRIHKPHPKNILKKYQICDIISVLSERGLL